MSKRPKGYSAKPLKLTVTTKPYECTLGFGPMARTIRIPEGWPITNQTAMGPDDTYRFPARSADLAKLNCPEHPMALAHDLTYHCPNIPAEFCAPWPETASEKWDREWKERQAAFPLLAHVYAEKGGLICPMCGAENVECGDTEVKGSTMERVDCCRSCSVTWVAVFKLERYTVL